MPASRAVLSLEPKAEIAKFLAAGGARPMAASPTATTGALFCAPMLATNWPTPTATAPASRPATAPKSGRDLSVSDVMVGIRRSRARGLVALVDQAKHAPGPNGGYGHD